MLTSSTTGDEEDEEYGERRVRFDVDDEEDGMEEETHRPAARADAKKAKQAALWFSRGIFQDVGAIEDGEPDESEDDDDDDGEEDHATVQYPAPSLPPTRTLRHVTPANTREMMFTINCNTTARMSATSTTTTTD